MNNSAEKPSGRARRIAREADEIEQAEDRLEALAGRAGVASLMKNEALTGAELLRVLGGVRGLCETLLPSVAFVSMFATGQVLAWDPQRNLTVSLAVSLGLAVLFVVIRVLQRSQSRSALAGLVAASASAAVALITGNPEDNYLLGIGINVVYGLALLISIPVGWPILGVFVGFVMGDGTNWRSVPRRYRTMQWLTLMWAALFGIRLLVEIPLYLADNVVALGVAKLVLGTPLYAAFLVLTWLVARAMYPRSSEPAE